MYALFKDGKQLQFNDRTYKGLIDYLLEHKIFFRLDGDLCAPKGYTIEEVKE